MRIEDPGWKNFGPGIRDGKNTDPGWKKYGSGIRDKHFGSAALCRSKENQLLNVSLLNMRFFTLTSYLG
jgi:hypothetical protein